MKLYGYSLDEHETEISAQKNPKHFKIEENKNRLASEPKV